MYYVYMLASRRNGTLYTGVTKDLVKRVWEHRTDLDDGFTSRYRVHRLVWFESTPDVSEAILREKRIKKWRRSWKLEMIERENPHWRDLYESIAGSRT